MKHREINWMHWTKRWLMERNWTNYRNNYELNYHLFNKVNTILFDFMLLINNYLVLLDDFMLWIYFDEIFFCFFCLWFLDFLFTSIFGLMLMILIFFSFPSIFFLQLLFQQQWWWWLIVFLLLKLISSWAATSWRYLRPHQYPWTITLATRTLTWTWTPSIGIFHMLFRAGWTEL